MSRSVRVPNPCYQATGRELMVEGYCWKVAHLGRRSNAEMKRAVTNKHALWRQRLLVSKPRFDVAQWR